VGVPFLLFGVEALVGSVAALLAGWTFVGVAFVLFGVADLLVLNCRGGWLRRRPNETIWRSRRM
jgi:hypothetical protein